MAAVEVRSRPWGWLRGLYCVGAPILGLVTGLMVSAMLLAGLIRGVKQFHLDIRLSLPAVVAIAVAVTLPVAWLVARELLRDYWRYTWRFDGRRLTSPSLDSPLDTSDVLAATVGVDRIDLGRAGRAAPSPPVRAVHNACDTAVVLYFAGGRAIALQLGWTTGGLDVMNAVLDAVRDRIAAGPAPKTPFVARPWLGLIERIRWNQLVNTDAPPPDPPPVASRLRTH